MSDLFLRSELNFALDEKLEKDAVQSVTQDFFPRPRVLCRGGVYPTEKGLAEIVGIELGVKRAAIFTRWVFHVKHDGDIFAPSIEALIRAESACRKR